MHIAAALFDRWSLQWRMLDRVLLQIAGRCTMQILEETVLIILPTRAIKVKIRGSEHRNLPTKLILLRLWDRRFDNIMSVYRYMVINFTLLKEQTATFLAEVWFDSFLCWCLRFTLWWLRHSRFKSLQTGLVFNNLLSQVLLKLVLIVKLMLGNCKAHFLHLRHLFQGSRTSQRWLDWTVRHRVEWWGLRVIRQLSCQAIILGAIPVENASTTRHEGHLLVWRFWRRFWNWWAECVFASR